jgi:hypothetical protein
MMTTIGSLELRTEIRHGAASSRPRGQRINHYLRQSLHFRDIASRRAFARNNHCVQPPRHRREIPHAPQRDQIIGNFASVSVTTRQADLAGLDQFQRLQTGMAVLADDDVVVHGDAERSGDVDDRPGHLHIRLRRRRVAGRVVMHQDDRGGG